MRKPAQNKGFTLIEILLVVVIIGLMLAVIVPRAWRANVDTKYNLVRQNCNELASFGMEWVEQQMQAQPEDKGTRMLDYLLSLARFCVADPASNWTGAPVLLPPPVPVANQLIPETTVDKIVPPDKVPRNPFNGVSVFGSPNNPNALGTTVAGAIGCGWANDNTTPGVTYQYFAFIWEGTGSTWAGFNVAGSWHAGQDGDALAGLRNGVFFARTR